MRCYCCNSALSDYESTLRSATTNEFLDTCRKCLKDLDINVIPSKTIEEPTNESDISD